MNENTPKPSPTPVFCCSKALSCNTRLSCEVILMPQKEFHCTSYTFSLSLSHGALAESETVEDVTVNRDEAEHIFNLICTHNVYPCHLYDVISDLIA